MKTVIFRTAGCYSIKYQYAAPPLKETITLICCLIITSTFIRADLPPPPPTAHLGEIRIGSGISDTKTNSSAYDGAIISKISLNYRYRQLKERYEVSLGIEYIYQDLFLDRNGIATQEKNTIHRICLPVYLDIYIDWGITIGAGPFISYSIKEDNSRDSGIDFGISARIQYYINKSSWILGYEYRYGEIYDSINFDTHCLTLAYQFNLKDVFGTKPKEGNTPL